MRKLLLSLLCLLFMTGVVLSADAIFVSFKDSKLTVKEGDAEKTYTVNDSTKIIITDADGNKKDGKLKMLENMKSGKSKMVITTEKDVVTTISVKAGKKKPQE